MSREEKINKMIEEIKIRRNDEQYRGGPFPIYHIEFDILNEEIERLNNIIKNIENICESSIASVDNILQDEKETKIANGRCINRNEYQIVRLKAYRTKSKEILGRIKELKGSDKE